MAPIGSAFRTVSSRASWADKIPDSEVYLHDDWGDNKLTNRDDSGTTTYNGVEGVYRPEWTTDGGSPNATGGALQWGDGDLLRADLNLDFSSEITWTFENWRVDSTGSGADTCVCNLTANQTDATTGDEYIGGYHEGYILVYARSGDSLQTLELLEMDSAGGSSHLVDASGSSDYSAGVPISVTRSPSGEWELLIGGNSQGTASDTSHTSVSHMGFFGRDSRGGLAHSLDEIKLS